MLGTFHIAILEWYYGQKDDSPFLGQSFSPQHCSAVYPELLHWQLLLFLIIIIIIIIIIIKRGRQCKADPHPISQKTPATQIQPIDRKKRKGKIVEDKNG